MAEREEEARVSESEREERSAEAAVDQPSGSAGEESADALRAMLEAARSEADGYLNLAQRVQADFVNYKRRVEAEREAQAEAIRAETLRSFLPVVDDLERALRHVPAEAAEQSWVEGFRLIERNLAAVLARLGVQRLGSEGEPFDPNIHEAVAYEVDPRHPEGHVATVLRPGYQLGSRVVRPAQVVVARAAEPAGEHVTDEGMSAWPHHQAPGGTANGGGDRADLHEPRHIQRGSAGE